MPHPTDDAPSVLEQAFDLIRQGRTVEAEEAAVEAVRAAGVTFGAGSEALASAWNELGTVRINVGDVRGAVAAYREACADPMPVAEAAVRDRLTYLMNLGMALHQADESADAETVFRQGLEGRAAYYGTDHPGYAFGLEPLADLLLQTGRVDEALDMLDTAVSIFWENAHPRAATALALRAEALVLGGHDEAPFDGLEAVPDDIVEAIATHALGRRHTTDPGILSGVLQALLPLIRDRFDRAHALVAQILACIANLEAARGADADASVRLHAASELVALFDEQARPQDALQAMLGLALALGDAGEHDDAVTAYQDACARAELLGDPAANSLALRNLGLLLAELGRDEPAEVALSGAVSTAEDATDTGLLVRAWIALGIFCQHRRRFDEAMGLLTKALGQADPAEPDTIVARSHLRALQAGDGCGCGDTGAAMAEAFREFVLSRLPEDLLEEFAAEWVDGDFQLHVRLRREPTEAELNHLNRVINHALTEFRARLRG